MIEIEKTNKNDNLILSQKKEQIKSKLKNAPELLQSKDQLLIETLSDKEKLKQYLTDSKNTDTDTNNKLNNILDNTNFTELIKALLIISKNLNLAHKSIVSREERLDAGYLSKSFFSDQELFCLNQFLNLYQSNKQKPLKSKIDNLLRIFDNQTTKEQFNNKNYFQLKGNKTTVEQLKSYFYDGNNFYSDNPVDEKIGKDLLKILEKSGNENISFKDAITETTKTWSKEDKIRLCVIFSKYMGTIGYDTKRAGTFSTGAPSVDQMRATFANNGVAGVCRDHAGMIAELLQSFGFKNAGILTVMSGGRHAITFFKNDNGKYNLIDYGNIYEFDNPKAAIAFYEIKYKHVQLTNDVADAQGNVIQKIKSEIGEFFGDQLGGATSGKATEGIKHDAKETSTAYVKATTFTGVTEGPIRIGALGMKGDINWKNNPDNNKNNRTEIIGGGVFVEGEKIFYNDGKDKIEMFTKTQLNAIINNYNHQGYNIKRIDNSADIMSTLKHTKKIDDNTFSILSLSGGADLVFNIRNLQPGLLEKGKIKWEGYRITKSGNKIGVEIGGGTESGSRSGEINLFYQSGNLYLNAGFKKGIPNNSNGLLLEENKFDVSATYNLDIYSKSQFDISPTIKNILKDQGIGEIDMQEALKTKRSEIISNIQLVALANIDKIQSENDLVKLGFRMEGGKLFIPKGLKDKITSNDLTSFSQNLTQIRYSTQAMFDATSQDKLLTGTMQLTKNLGEKFTFESVVSMGLNSYYINALIGKRFGNKTLQVGAYGSDQSVGGEIRSTTNTKDGKSTTRGLFGGMSISGQIALGLIYGKGSQLPGDISEIYRVGTEIQKYSIKNPGENVINLMNGEAFAKFGNVMYTLTKNPEDIQHILSISSSLQKIINSKRGIFFSEQFFADMKDSTKIQKFDKWLKNNLANLQKNPQSKTSAEGNIHFQTFNDTGNNMYNENRDYVIIASTNTLNVSTLKGKDQILKQKKGFLRKEENIIYNEGKSLENTRNIILNLAHSLLSDQQTKLKNILTKLDNNQIELEFQNQNVQNYNTKFMSGLIKYFERLETTDAEYNKMKHRKIKIVDTATPNLDNKLIIEIPKNTIMDIADRNVDYLHKTQINITQGSQINTQLFYKYKNKIEEYINNGKDIKSIKILPISKFDDSINTSYIEQNFKLQNGEIQMSDRFMNKLIEDMEHPRQNKGFFNRLLSSDHIKLFKTVIENTHLNSTKKIDNLVSNLDTQEQRSVQFLRELGQAEISIFIPTLSETGQKYIIDNDNNITCKYEVYDYQNTLIMNTKVTLKKNNDVIVSLIYKENGTTKIKHLKLNDQDQINQLAQDFPHVYKAVIGDKGISSETGKNKYLSGALYDIDLYRNSLKK